MKIRLDYVSNSSSASFICYISSNDTDINHFKISLKKLMDRFIQDEVPFLEGYGWNTTEDDTYRERVEYHQTHLDQLLERTDQITNNTYKLESYTSMLNSLLQNTEPFFTFILLESMMAGLMDYGIRSVQLRLDEDCGGHYR